VRVRAWVTETVGGCDGNSFTGTAILNQTCIALQGQNWMALQPGKPATVADWTWMRYPARDAQRVIIWREFDEWAA